MDRIDLHAHTTCSDGSMTPTELFEHAREVGLKALAVTDHDTLAGWSESRRAAAATGVEWIPGCEISTRLPTGTVHVLAYDADAGDTDLQDLLSGIRTARDARNDAILGRLDRLGVGVTREDVEQAAPSPLIARPHIAMALVHRGHVEDIREAFDRYLRDGGPAYVPVEAPTPEEAIEIVAAARGMAVIAHPRQMKLGSHARQRRVFTRWRDLGLAGIEVDHPSHDVTHRILYRDLTEILDLVPTGGSDFHGRHKPHIALGEGDGTIDMRYATWERLQEKRR